MALSIKAFERTGSDLLLQFHTEDDAIRAERAITAYGADEEPVVEPVPESETVEPEQGLLIRYRIKKEWDDGMVVVALVGNATEREQTLAVRLSMADKLEEVWGGTYTPEGDSYVIRSDKAIPVGGAWDFTFKVRGTDGRIEFSSAAVKDAADSSPAERPTEQLEPVAVSQDAPGTPVYSPFIASSMSIEENLIDQMGAVYDGGWEWENIQVIDELDGPCLRTHMGEGLYVGDKGKCRGAGFDTRTMQAEHAILEYDLRFKPGFDPVKGGKLPGLMGGDSPSGHKEADNGFTARMMWRRKAEGELYLYYPDMKQSHGDSIGRGSFVCDTEGGWHTIRQEVKLNDVGKSNGLIKVWYDGEMVIEATDLRLRTKDSVLIEGIMHTIFFGGGDRSWAATRDEWVDTRNFRIYTP
jgi:hypothetical protein